MRSSPNLSKPPGPSLLEVRRDEQGFGLAVHGCLIVVVWGRVVELRDIRALTEVQHEVVGRYGCCLVMSIIRAGIKMTVDDDVRQASEKNLREFEKVNWGSAMVVEAGGLRATFFRSVMTGIHFVARSPVPQKVFDNIDEAVRWLLDRPGLDPAIVDSADPLTASAYEVADRFGEPAATAAAR